MAKEITLIVHGYYETLDIDGNVNSHHVSGELPYGFLDGENLLAGMLETGDFSHLRSPRCVLNPKEGQDQLRREYLSNTNLCECVFHCDCRYVFSFVKIETEPILNDTLKYVFLDNRKHIQDKWVLAI